MSTALDFLIFATCWSHVLLAPYTKVEESFNLHATHDVLLYGTHPGTLFNYDHFVFPGAVPRTFIGSILLAWISTPVILLAERLELLHSKFDLQIVIRLVLATMNSLTLCMLRRVTAHRFGGPAGVLFALLTCSQFHLPFWVGRTLPNMFALVPVNIASCILLYRSSNKPKPTPRDLGRVIALLTFTSIVFRAEVALLLAPVTVHALFSGGISFKKLLKVGVVSGLASIVSTVLVDSYFWDQWPLWPELNAIYFNVVQGKSSEWGISPPQTYFVSFLPKLLLGALPLSVVGALVDHRVRSLLFAPTVFICMLSALGHKEWRFIVYVVPVFNAAAARGATWMISRRKGSLFGRLSFLAVAGLLVINCAVTYLLTLTSIANYPGGAALSEFNDLFADQQNVHVHISNLAAQTGASLFLQTHAPPYPSYLPSLQPQVNFASDWIYNKTENLTAKTLTSQHQITHVIAETDQGSIAPASHFDLREWDIVDSVQAFERWRPNIGLLKGHSAAFGWELFEMVKSDKLIILQRK
ncbi:hypothetical protein K474DRAFT_1639550 [Panus rudis PR-1116 ss-1]|nr:hypothetical protein K474DRAFT_1639550 [Panus rudis PR-1116 ss-1]